MWQGDTQYASPGYLTRFQQYNGSALPLAQFGGYLSVPGGGGDMYNSYLTRYNIVNNIDSPLSMSLSSDIIGDQIIMQANIEVTDQIETSNNKVVFILTSYQDEEYFCSVISYNYSTFDLNTVGQSDVFEMSVTIDPGWDINQLTFIGLVQSYQDDHILQASSTQVPLNNLLVMDTQISGVVDDEGGDGDGVANPGEDIYLSIDIINESEELIPSNSQISISSTSDGIIVLESEYLHQEEIQSGQYFTAFIPIQIEDDIALGEASFDIVLDCFYIDNYSNELLYTKSFERNLEVNLYQSGFPFITNSQVLTSPAIFDIDQDGIKEVIFGDYLGRLHVTDSFGIPKSGFPFDLGDQIWGSPAVSDIDNDGDIEIVVCSKNKKIHVINSDGTEQFQYNTGKYLIGTPALGNLDDDNDLEIVIGSYSTPTSSNKLYVINPDGSDVSGFPITIGEKIQRGVALADFNQNGKEDIVFGTDDENIYLIYDDGTIAEGFPFEGDGDFKSEITILNINQEKIIFAGSKSGTFYALDNMGEIIFSLETSDDIMASPSVLYNGEDPIIFFGNDDGFLYALHLDGTDLDGWPITLSSNIISSPTFSDLNGDGIPEIVVSLDDGSIHIVDINGNNYANSPFQYAFPYSGSVAINDIDLDGDLEIFCGSGDGMNVFDIKETGNNTGYWNMFRGNLQRTGYYSRLLMGDINNDGTIDILDIILVVNFILNNNNEVNSEVADMNGDGNIDVSDIILILNSILIDL